MKKAEFWNIYPEFWPNKLNQNNQQCLFVFKSKVNNTILKNLNKFLRIVQNWRKFRQKFRKMWIKTTWIHSTFLRNLNIDNSLKKMKIKKIFLIPYSTLDGLSNVTSLNALRWICRSAKIDWTKKTIWVYSSSPLMRGRNNKRLCDDVYVVLVSCKWNDKFIRNCKSDD